MEMPLAPAPVEVQPSLPAEFPGPETDPPSLCTLQSFGGSGATLWSLPHSRITETEHLVQLQLAPEAYVIIGRANGGEIEYLDPRYTPSSILPGTGKTVLQHGGHQQDLTVSRGHFMLRGRRGGIALVNGVPRRGGGVRPPLNGTQLLEPQQRALREGEELVIERDCLATIQLPNGTRLTIRAE